MQCYSARRNAPWPLPAAPRGPERTRRPTHPRRLWRKAPPRRERRATRGKNLKRPLAQGER
jgi:hypothetical protein